MRNIVFRFYSFAFLAEKWCHGKIGAKIIADDSVGKNKS